MNNPPTAVVGLYAVKSTATAGSIAESCLPRRAIISPNASTGSQLWSASRSPMMGGVSISGSSVFVGSFDHNVYAFTLPNNSPPAPPPASAALTVTSPSSGEQWTKGERYNITWNASGGVSKVDVSISRDGGATWDLLADDLDAALGTLRVKAKKPKSETVMIRVTDSSNSTVFGESGMFYIR